MFCSKNLFLLMCQISGAFILFLTHTHTHTHTHTRVCVCVCVYFMYVGMYDYQIVSTVIILNRTNINKI